MIEIVNWSTFQHFKDRRPIWIKLYRRLLHDREWRRLDGDAAKLLVDLWMVAADGQSKEDWGRIHASTADICYDLRLDQAKFTASLQVLVEQGFVRSDIGAISARYQDDALETEKETEESRDRGRGRRAGARPGKTAAPATTASDDDEKLIAYVGDEHRDAVVTVLAMPGTNPTTARGIMQLYGPGPKIDPRMGRVPEADRPRTLALALNRFATDATEWRRPYFESFHDRAWQDIRDGEKTDESISRHSGGQPIITERSKPAPPLKGPIADVTKRLARNLSMDTKEQGATLDRTPPEGRR